VFRADFAIDLPQRSAQAGFHVLGYLQDS